VGVRAGTGLAAGPRAGWAPVALPAGLVVAGSVSVQVGAGFANRLFGEVPASAVTTLRLWPAALIMLVVAGRSTARVVAGLARRRAWRDGLVTLSFGIILGSMNFSIYQAMARLPLGIAVTIEFLGPLAVTVAGSLTRGRPGSPARRLVSLGYAVLAAGGVVLLAGTVGPGQLNWAGVAWGVAAGTLWAGYIVASQATGQRLPGSAGLVLAMCVAAVVVTGPGVAAGAPVMFRPSLLAEGAGIGLLSSVIPYWLELEALRRIPAGLFGVWMSAQPAVAALIGLVLLGQHLAPAEWAGVGCVVAASAGAAHAAAAAPGGGRIAAPAAVAGPGTPVTTETER
jgi:inner membrane transporter RhtA